jgi:hypothetical protein
MRARATHLKGGMKKSAHVGGKMQSNMVAFCRNLLQNHQKIDLGGKFNAKFCHSRKM